MHYCCVSFLFTIEATHPSWVVMIAMDAEHRNRDVQVFILIVYPGEPTTHHTCKNSFKINTVLMVKKKKRKEKKNYKKGKAQQNRTTEELTELC